MIPSKTVTKTDLQNAIPDRKNAITDELVDLINQIQTEPEFQGETMVQTMITYQNALKGARVSMRAYVNAIRFCAYLVSMDDNYTEAYKRTFYDTDFVKVRANVSTSDPRYAELTSAASRYRRSKLVVDILTLSQVPLDMLFAGYRYKAMAVLAETMVTAKLDRDRIQAARSVLEMTKSDTIKVDLDVGVKESSAVASLKTQLAEMAAQQVALLNSGTTSLKELGGLKPVEDAEIVNG